MLSSLNIVNFIKYFLASFCGLLLDCLVLVFFNFIEIPIFFSNIISSSVGIFTTYLASGILMKNLKNRTKKQFIIFVLYYGISTIFFSFILHFIVNKLGFFLAVGKLLILGASFLLNYFFASKILKF